MRKVGYLVIAIVGNALGTVLMNSTSLGMTAWGASSSNVANFFHLSLSNGFLILSIIFYITAVLIRRKFIWNEFLQSFAFMFGFKLFTDLFAIMVPDLTGINIFLRYGINTIGFLILFFAIAVHIKVYIAVHPMDVYLREMQIKLKNVAIGSYISYATAFIIAIIFGVIGDGITDIGYGTILTLAFGGIVLDSYNRFILNKWKF